MAAVKAVGRAAGLEPLEPVDDRAATLYERHYGRVFGYCRSRLHGREDAEDAVQTTFMHAFNGLRAGVEPAHELAWLLGIARNVCLSRIESAGRRGRLELAYDPVRLERSAAPLGRSDELIGLEEALARLPEQQRRAVVLRDWRGLSYEEVASQLGVSLANVETLIFRGRRTLAELLREERTSTRHRLTSLGDAGSLLAWAKAGFGGAAAASKLAAAVAVVAVSGAAVAVGNGPLAGEPGAAERASAQRLAEGKPFATSTGGSPSGTAPAAPTGAAPRTNEPSDVASQGARAPGQRPAQAQATLAPTADRATTESAPPAVPAGDTASQGSSGPAARIEQPARKAALPKAPEAVEKVGDTVEQAVPALAPVTEAVVEPVVEIVGSLPAPELPVATPPVVEDVVESLPPATVTPPAQLPVGPITVDPGTLLP